jgi:formate hydrogenlyase subunit 3/multisubunit Na+/H+ antiporter MnhD subunit
MIGSFFSLLATFAYGPEIIAIALATPLVFLTGCAAQRLRAARPALLALAPVPALAAAIVAADSGPLVLDQTLFPAVFVLDPPGALLLGASALLWIAAGAFAIAVMREEMENGWFAACWLLTLLGNIGVFLSADLVSFYLAFALVSLPALGLIAGSRGMEDVGRLYFFVALLGEAFLIVAFVALALGAPEHSLLISDGVDALAASPWRNVALALLIAGFATKIGLVPFHVWMPSSYRAASIPAAAVLSGAAVNAGVIGLIHFLPWGLHLAFWGDALVAFGMIGAFYGVAIGLTQRDAKAILAYSSVSQMGLVAATLGKGLVAGNAAAAGAAALYAAHHGLAKGGLFLAVGVVLSRVPGRSAWIEALVALLALSLAGLPLTGGAIAKLAIKEPLGDGVVGALSILSAAATTLLMLHFLARLLKTPRRRAEPFAPSPISPWLVVATASVGVPAVCLFAGTPAGLATLLDYRLVWEFLWPVLAGAALGAAYGRRLDQAPNVPEGDIAALLQRAGEPSEGLGVALECADNSLRKWPVAAAMLLAVATVIAGTGIFAR